MSLLCGCHRSDSPLWLLVQHCTVALSLILCCLWDVQMADVWFAQRLRTLVTAALQGCPGFSAVSALSCLTSIPSANCKAWTRGKNEIHVYVVPSLHQHVIYKLLSSGSLNLRLSVSHWKVLGLKFWKGQHSTFCMGSAPEPNCLWQATVPARLLASSEPSSPTCQPPRGFYMPWKWEGFISINDKQTQYCGLTSMQRFPGGEELIMCCI